VLGGTQREVEARVVLAPLEGTGPPGVGHDDEVTQRRDWRDIVLLFTTRSLRMFAYGFLAVVLVLYLQAVGLNGAEVGILLALTLLGDAAISLLLTTRADRWGRRRTLFAGSLLMLGAGLVFASSTAFPVLLVAATLGVLSPSGNEVGPFLAIEQASLAQLVPDRERTSTFARYQVAGAVSTGVGSLAAGTITQLALQSGAAPADAYRVVIAAYAVVGLVMAFLFPALTRAVEVERRAAGAVATAPPTLLGLHRSRGIVGRLAALFALDAFGGGFVMLGFIAFWLTNTFDADPAVIGGILFAANILAAISALAAGPLAARFGLIRTMVFTHLPSNVLLILVPFMPTLGLATLVLLVRFSISQMDVPTRQSYTIAVVDPDERSAAAGVTGIARSLGVSLSPLIAGPLYLGTAFAGSPFVIGGTIKIVYDLLLYRAFRALRPPEERQPGSA
jgi:MFS family permease